MDRIITFMLVIHKCVLPFILMIQNFHLSFLSSIIVQKCDCMCNHLFCVGEGHVAAHTHLLTEHIFTTVFITIEVNLKPQSHQSCEHIRARYFHQKTWKSSSTVYYVKTSHTRSLGYSLKVSVSLHKSSSYVKPQSHWHDKIRHPKTEKSWSIV